MDMLWDLSEAHDIQVVKWRILDCSMQRSRWVQTLHALLQQDLLSHAQVIALLHTHMQVLLPGILLQLITIIHPIQHVKRDNEWR